MKAVIYARYSSDNQREESIEEQLREYTAFAEENGITILRSYIDRAFSAKTDNRPQFQEMIRDSSRKLFDMVIVWKLDRFARNRYDIARYRDGSKTITLRDINETIFRENLGSDIDFCAVPKNQMPAWVSGLLYFMKKRLVSTSRFFNEIRPCGWVKYACGK